MRRKDEGVTPQPQSSQTPSRGRFGLLLVSARNRARTAGGIPASRTAHGRTHSGRFLLRRIAHWATASFVPLFHTEHK